MAIYQRELKGRLCALILLFCVLSGGCIFGSDNNKKSVNVLAVNQSAEPIHIIADDNAFSSSNRIQPGDSRLIRVGDLGVVDFVTFHAGRNGQVLLSVECQYVGGTSEERNRERELVYDGQSLRCVGWL